MAEFNPTPYKGEASVPHVPEDWFTSLFIGAQVGERRKGLGAAPRAGRTLARRPPALAAAVPAPACRRRAGRARPEERRAAPAAARHGRASPGAARRRLPTPPPRPTHPSPRCQLAVAVKMLPGRLFGLDPRPNRLNRDYAVRCANEAAMSGAARKGRVPTLALAKPRATAASWRSMWANHLHWKAWTLDRQGGGHTPRV